MTTELKYESVQMSLDIEYTLDFTTMTSICSMTERLHSEGNFKSLSYNTRRFYKYFIKIQLTWIEYLFSRTTLFLAFGSAMRPATNRPAL